MNQPASTLSSHDNAFAILQNHIEKVFVGKETVVQNSLTCLLAGGHLLIEDVPGVGKTTLALSLAKSTGCSFQRIQFTNDMMPSDILGVSVFNSQTQDFEFRPGPLFNQVILADELNRATPRTQSALLEAMNERQVSLDNQTMPLPAPFFVVATQNPHEHHGTYPLPESQLDRFMMRLTIGYPDEASEKAILTMGTEHNAARTLNTCLSPVQLLQWMDQVRHIHVAAVIDDYILALVKTTRSLETVDVGVSPRGAIALRKAAQARAMLQSRDHVTPDDIKALAVPVLAHRLIFSGDSLVEPVGQSEQIISSLLQNVAIPI